MNAIKYFPYTPRPHQFEAIKEIESNLRLKNICLHAPTGFGKTPVIMSTLIPFILRGLKVIWAVRTGNETDRPIEELKIITRKLNLPIFGISYRGKKDMCLLAERFGEELDYSDVSYICRLMRKNCQFYLNYKDKFDFKPYISKGPLLYNEVYSVSKRLDLCPYYVQRALAKIADVVSLSYNYVVNPIFEWSIRVLIPFSRSILVVDEAHNLQNLELNSDTITLGTIRRARKEAEEFNAENVVSMLNYAEDRMLEIHSSLEDEEDTEFNPQELLPEDYLALLDEAEHVGELVRKEKLEKGSRPRSSLYHFASFMISALDLIDTEGIAFIAERVEDNLKLNIWDMRASEILSERWLLFRRCIFCSGTLKPIEAFVETIGLSNYHSIVVPNIYNRSNIAIYILNDVSTRGEELSLEMASRYVKAIMDFLNVVKTNTAIFTASYRIQEAILSLGLARKIEKLGFKVFIEHKNMTGPKSRKILENFKKASINGNGVLIAPIGGRFAEGADFPGRELEAIFLVGIPFAKPSVRIKLYIEYYTKLYGSERGRFYAYTLPALRRASQALGRAIRSLEDKGVFILGDQRYLSYLEFLPEYVKEWHKIISYDEVDAIKVPWT
ncbi:MAG: hypothetical protein NDF54_07630 [archaeon GB-1867-035]|nr:hypothetical protein [Candidatus Culexmicrobium profundum]